MRRLALLASAMLLTACSEGDSGEDVSPLPEQTNATANVLMTEAEQAATNASARAETASPPTRSDPQTTNEVTR